MPRNAVTRRTYAVADCETLPFKKGRYIKDAYVWEFWDGETRFVTYDTEEFVNYLYDYDGIVYAHNGGKFDWHFLLPYLEAYEEILIINGRIAKVRLGACELRDSFCILPARLADYKKDDFDYSLLEVDQRRKPGNAKKILSYLHSDCVALYEWVSRFITDYGLHLTLAGACMKHWVKMSDKPAPRTDAGFYSDWLPFYTGGRVQCFQSGILEGKRWKKYDINSAYPYAMMQPHPYSDTYDEESGFVLGADFYEVECISLGAFPYRVGEGRAITYPEDNEHRVYFVSCWEFEAAKETGTMWEETVLRSFSFHDHVNFTQYVDHFMDLRWECKAKGDTAGAIIAKFFGNSLYGKFAANPDNYENHMIVPMDIVGGLPDAGWSFGGEIGPWALAKQPLQESRKRFYNVATGASITGFVRAMLWRAICSSKGVVYCDTDAITCEEPGEFVMPGEALGQWKHEGDFDRLGIAGKKLYIMRGAKGWWKVDGKIVHSLKKPKGAERLYASASKGARLTHAQLWRVAADGEVEYESESPTFSVNKEQSFVKRKIRKTAK